MVVMLVLVHGMTAVVQLAVEIPALATGEATMVEPAIQMLLVMDIRIAAVETVLLTPGELAAHHALVNALMLIVQALVNAVCIGGHRQKGRAQQGCDRDTFDTIDFHGYFAHLSCRCLSGTYQDAPGRKNVHKYLSRREGPA